MQGGNEAKSSSRTSRRYLPLVVSPIEGPLSVLMLLTAARSTRGGRTARSPMLPPRKTQFSVSSRARSSASDSPTADVAPQARGGTNGKTANNALQQTVTGVTPLAGLARGRWCPHGVAQGARRPARC